MRISAANTRKTGRKKTPQMSTARRAQLMRALPSRIQYLKSLNIVKVIESPAPSVPTTPEDEINQAKEQQARAEEKEKEEKRLKLLEAKLKDLNSAKHALFLSLKEILHAEEVKNAQAQKEKQNAAVKSLPVNYIQQANQTFGAPSLSSHSDQSIHKYPPQSAYYGTSDQSPQDPRLSLMSRFSNGPYPSPSGLGHEALDEIKKVQLAMLHSQNGHSHHPNGMSAVGSSQMQQGNRSSSHYGYQGLHSPAKSPNMHYMAPSASYQNQHQQMDYQRLGTPQRYAQHHHKPSGFSHQRKEAGAMAGQGYW
eukprot:TRINITY_DN11353_c0_g1_i1.p1 TRINITY_DN11353_c0_g1~~TRINITY_DN11353_c0_g1_i1.p1  ORF type:complete len:308 (+),score=77.23 TRINITY_DN11353_c0_g1_i1:444-1367(+)